MKKTRVFTAPTTDISYYELLAVSLIKYAEQNSAFALFLKDLIARLSNFKPGLKYFTRLSNFKPGLKYFRPGLIFSDLLRPQDENQAVCRALWLVERISQKETPDISKAKVLLETWANSQTFERPKELVVGITPLAIPGITLGLLKIKKELPVIIRKDLTKEPALKIAKMASQALAGLVSKALLRAKYNVRKLEPEMGDWLFGGGAVVFYSAENSELKKINLELKKLKAIYYPFETEGQLTALALSPAFNEDSLALFWQVTPI